jgi:hypothetical protein
VQSSGQYRLLARYLLQEGKIMSPQVCLTLSLPIIIILIVIASLVSSYITIIRYHRNLHHYQYRHHHHYHQHYHLCHHRRYHYHRYHYHRYHHHLDQHHHFILPSQPHNTHVQKPKEKRLRLDYSIIHS